jgi:hypothetical protein
VAAGHPGQRVELWFQDEARVGQKGRTGRRWWMRGQRPRGLCDQRYDWTYLYAAVRPATGQGFALVLPLVSIRAMNLFLKRFAESLAPDVHAVLVLDQAGWHGSRRVRVPKNVTLLPLPPTRRNSTPSNASGSTSASGSSPIVCSTATPPSSTPCAKLGMHSPPSASAP